MENSDYQEQARFMRRYESLEGFPEIKGYNFEKEFNFEEFMNAFKSMGIQGTQLGMGIDIINKMIEDNSFIFLSATSNMVSSGNRDILKYLVKHKKIHALVMSAGAVEEDIIKCFKSFVIGSFDIAGRALFDKGVGRIGNIFAPYDRYLYFEKFMNPFFDRIYREMQKGKILTPSEFIKELGKEIEKEERHEESIVYWAFKNDIPIFSPALTDGSLGDLMHFQKQKRKDFIIDMVGDHTKIVTLALNQEKTGAIILGGGVSKHYILNANIFRDGLDYAVYVTTAQEYDASDSGGNPQEAMTWAKLKVDAPNVKIRCEATIAFPLLVAATFKKQESKLESKR